MVEWNGKLSRIQAIKIIDSITDQADPYWENHVEDYCDEDSDTMPSIYHVFAALGVSEQEYKDATGADNVNWPSLTHNAGINVRPHGILNNTATLPGVALNDGLYRISDNFEAKPVEPLARMPMQADRSLVVANTKNQIDAPVVRLYALSKWMGPDRPRYYLKYGITPCSGAQCRATEPNFNENLMRHCVAWS